MKSHWGKDRGRRGPKAAVGCEALEGRQLLTRGLGIGGLGGFGFGREPVGMRAELGAYGGGRPGAMFGGGALGLGGGLRDPLFLLTAPVLQATSGSATPPTRAALGSSAVQSAFQTLQTDFNNVVPVGARPTHASVGQLQDDLASIRKGTLTGTAATTAIQNDEAAILTSIGLTSTQVAQIQTDIQNVQTVIQNASSGTTGTNGATTTSTSSTSSTPAPWLTSPPMGSATTTSTTPPANSAVQTAYQTLQTDLGNTVPVGARPSFAAIGKVLDDLSAIARGKLTGSSAVSTVQADTGAVLTSEGLTSSQVAQIQSDQAALGVAIQAAQPSAIGGRSSGTTRTSASPTSIAGVQATMQSVQPYLVGIPGFGGGGFGGGMEGGLGGGMRSRFFGGGMRGRLFGGGGMDSGLGGTMTTNGSGGFGGPMIPANVMSQTSVDTGSAIASVPMIPANVMSQRSVGTGSAVASVPMIPANAMNQAGGRTGFAAVNGGPMIPVAPPNSSGGGTSAAMSGGLMVPVAPPNSSGGGVTMSPVMAVAPTTSTTTTATSTGGSTTSTATTSTSSS